MNHIVSARDANQQFSRLLKQAEEGDTVIITRRGKPVARLVPEAQDVDREAAKARLLARMETGFPLGGEPFDRGECYDRLPDQRVKD